jgi:hypothetical protein
MGRHQLFRRLPRVMTCSRARAQRRRRRTDVQVSRLLHAHEIVLKEARTMARLATERKDDGPMICW